MNKNLMLALVAGGVVLVLGGGAYLYTQNKSGDEATGNSNNDTVQEGDFIRTGQDSFGLDVCNEMTKEEVGAAVNKAVTKTRDYSVGMSSGCEYYIGESHFVIVDVGYSDMVTQRKGLEALERTINSDTRIGLENMLVYSDRGLIDIYMNVEPGIKFVRVGRSSTSVVSEEDHINLAIAVEKKIRSYK